jgi:4-amino-4-deoxy-L-arabinose transferase-like glycosyltransferase
MSGGASLQKSTSVAAMLRKRHISSTLVLASIVVLALGIDFFKIETRSLWLDETFSATLAQLSWVQMWHVIYVDEANSMLYHLLLHFWTWLGSDELVLRSFSALAASACVLPLFGLMRLLYDERHGFLTCFLLAINAFVVQFAQEARGYALALLLVTTASYLFVRGTRKPAWTTWLLYAFTGAMSVYAHLYAAFVLLAHLITMPFVRPERRLRVLMFSSYGLVAFLLLPILVLFRSQGAGNIDFLEPPNLRALVGLYGELTGYGGPLLTGLYFLTCCAAFITLKLLRSGNLPGIWIGWATGPGDAGKFIFLLAWLFVPVLASFGISAFVPIYQPRYFIVSLPPLACIAAIGLLRLPRPVLVVLIVGFIGLSSRGLSALYEGRIYTEDWRVASRYVLTHSTSTDGIVFEAPWVRIPFEYYAKLRGFNASTPRPIFPSAQWGELSVISPQFEVTANRWLKTRPVAANRVWVVLAHQFAYGPRKRLLPPSFQKEYEPISQRNFASVSVTLYRRV